MEEKNYIKQISIDIIQEKIENDNNFKKEFENLLQDEKLTKLNNEINKFNPFRVLRLENNEIRHSNFLAWLLDTNGSHKLTNKFLMKILEKLKPDTKITNDTYVEVLREYKNIDILIKIDSLNFVCAIENKVWSGEHDDQLDKYEKIINEEFPKPETKHLFVYLTRTGAKASNDNYKSLSYYFIRDFLKDTLEIKKEDEKIKNFINDYIDILENDIQLKPSENINEFCKDISNNHIELIKSLYDIKDDLNNLKTNDINFNNLFRQKFNVIKTVLNNQKNLKYERDQKIHDILEDCFKNEYIQMHPDWAYKINLKNKKYPFKQVDYTTLPFENLKVHFYCGISKDWSVFLKQHVKTYKQTFIEGLKILQKENYRVEVGYRVNNGSGYGIISEFLTDNSDLFSNIFSDFENVLPGKIKIHNDKNNEINAYENIKTLELIKDSNPDLDEIIKNNVKTTAKQIIFLPVLYIVKELNYTGEDLYKENKKEEIKKEFLNITEKVFNLFQLEDEFNNLKK